MEQKITNEITYGTALCWKLDKFNKGDLDIEGWNKFSLKKVFLVLRNGGNPMEIINNELQVK